MNENEALFRMVAPGTRRPGKYREGVIQIHVTRACDKACFGCTQGSNLGGKTSFITPDQFRQAVKSLDGYFGVVGVFGGNPALHPQFDKLCEILEQHVPFAQRGLWCNNPAGKASLMRRIFNPQVSNLNVHLDVDAYRQFKEEWPESRPFGLDKDSRHSPPYVAMKDVLLKNCVACMFTPRHPDCTECHGTGKVYDEEKAWELISGCDINKHWSAMIGVFRGQLRAWFCEIAGAQSMLHQDDPDYPDTGMPIRWDGYLPVERERSGVALVRWWQLPMTDFAGQVRKHCHECGVPLRGYGELAQSTTGTEQVSLTHEGIYRPKRKDRKVQVVTQVQQLGMGRLQKMTDYLGNSQR